MSHQKTVSLSSNQTNCSPDLTDDQIQYYVETERPLNCAGSYVENLGISYLKVLKLQTLPPSSAFL